MTEHVDGCSSGIVVCCRGERVYKIACLRFNGLPSQKYVQWHLLYNSPQDEVVMSGMDRFAACCRP